MLTFIFAFSLLAIIITAMSVGVIFQNKPIKGSCGGMAALGMVSDCEICGGDRTKCDEENDRIASSQTRSEERRVGKECRYRGASDH